MQAFTTLVELTKKEGEGLSVQTDRDRRKGNGFKLKEGMFRIDVREKFFTRRLVRHWNRLAREAGDAQFLEVLKARL